VIKTEGLYHINLVVRDLERAQRFYHDVFGLEELFRTGPDMVFLSTPGKRDLITLHQSATEQQKAGDNGGVSHFGFRLADVSQLGEAVAAVQRAGGRLLSRGEHAPGVPFAYVTDVDGYVIELG